MRQGFLSSGPLEGIHFQKPAHEVQEVLVIALESGPERGLLSDQYVYLQLVLLCGLTRLTATFLRMLGRLLAALRLRVFGLLVDEALSSEVVGHETALLHHVLGEGPNDADDTREQTLDRVVLKKHVATEQLSQDATQGPDVDLVVVFAAENHLWRSVASRLHVG